MDILWAILLILGALLCWVLNVLAIPASNWVMIALGALYAWQGPDAGRLDLGWKVVVVLIVLAALGELVEFLAGALGAKRAGGSRRSAVLSVVGSISGGLMGAVVALPVPLVGPLIGAILFAAAGAFGGALLGERWKGRQWEETLEVGKGAFWGRLLGTFGKVVFSSMMVTTLLIGVLM